MSASPIHHLIDKRSDDSQNITVVCRVRPVNQRESNLGAGTARANCVTVPSSMDGPKAIVINTKPEPKTYTFDYVADEHTSQEKMFQVVGIPVTHTCLEGYNGTIICYGQTGSGKSFTTFGGSDATAASTTGTSDKGLVPRVLEYIWQHIEGASKPQADSPLQTTYTCSCSFYEIYQEKVYDLLDSATAAAGNGSNNNTNGNSLQVREDSKAGVYVEGLTEEFVSSPADANRVLALGHNNRHVGATAMNRESSRSHAVFLLVIRSVETNNDTNTKRNCVAKFSLVDLAGSERHKDTAASGERLKEASQINKSLSTLGNVIKALADRSTTAFSSASAASHFFIPYRDSKLTFLLRDSLGGNSKTVLVATVSPADSSVAETLSTLQFAQRAKCIKNVVVCNEETSGNVLALQKEIAILREKLAASGANGSSTFNNAARNFTLNTMCATPMAKQTRSRLSFGSPSEREPAVPAEPLSPTSQLRHSLVQLSSFFTNAAGDGAHTGGSSADNMLFKALNQRCQHLDESNGTLRSSLADMQGRVDQQEKVAMGMKMKLKMRETEISRLKSKTTGGDASDASGAAAAEAEVAQRIKVEVDAVRDELQGELIKHRMEIQEMRGNRDSFFQHLGEVASGSDSDNASIRDSLVKLIEQYNASTTKNAANIAVAGSNKSTSLLGAASSAGTGSVSNGYWSGPAEVKFQHDLLQRIATAEQTQSSLQSTMQKLIEQDFKKLTAVGADEDDAGVSVAEAKAFRRENRDLQRKIEAAEAEKTKYQNAIQLIRTRSEAAETKFAESKKELESKCSTFEQQNVEFSCQVANLTKDCAALSEKLANTQNGLVQSEKEAQDAIDKKEAAYRSEILQLRKDNSLLFQKYNELRDEHMRVLGVVSEMEGKVGELEEELSYTRSCADKDAEESSVVIDGLNGKIEAMNACIKTMEAEAHQHEATIAEYKESIAASQDAVFNLQEANRGLEVAAMTAAKNFNKLQFEFDNLQEDTDNLYTQQETLLSQHGESSAIIAENTAEIAKKAEEISQLQAILAEKESEASANLLSIMQEKAALIESVKKLETKVMLLNDEKGQQYNDFVVANTCLKSVSQSYATAKEQVAEVTNELNEVQSAMAGKDEEIAQLRAQCEENKASGAASEEATAKIESLTSANAELASSNTALQAQISSIVGAINQASLTPSDGDALTASGDEITSSLDSFRRSIEGEFQAKLDNMASQHAEELKDAASTHQLFVDNIMEQQAQALADAEAAAKIQGAAMAQSRIAEETATENVQLKEKLEEMSAQMQALKQEQSSATDKLKAENKLQAASIVAFKQQVAELNTKQTELAEQNAKLIGHTNTKQKIQLMQEYKAQLAEQDATIAALREQVASLMSGCWDKGKEDDAVVASGASAGVKSGSSSVTNAYVEALNAKKAAAAAVASSRARATALADRTNAHNSGQH